MILLAFFLGLAVGIGFWLRQQAQLQRQLQQVLRTLQTDASQVSLPVIPCLRREIALQEQQRKALQDQLQTWQQMLQVAPLGYLQVDEENQLLWCNEQAQQLLWLQRWEPGQVRLLLELVRSYELDQLIEQTREQQEPKVREWMFHPACADAAAMEGMRSLTLRASSWPLTHGQVGVFLENRQPLVELSQVRDRWVSDLAHELKTPLTSIRLVVETLQGRVDPSLRRWFDRLLPEVNRLISLVQNWLELSQLQINPSQRLKFEPVELRSLIYSVCQTLDPLLRRYQLKIAYLGPETVWLIADESHLTQVLLNLLDNSLKYSPLDGTIRTEIMFLSGTDTSSKVQINIIDSGPGFKDADLPYVFERLYRGDPARARRSELLSEFKSSLLSAGSGLGLAIVQQIVLAHGGSVKARNHPETGGAWLQIELPNAMTDSDN